MEDLTCDIGCKLYLATSANLAVESLVVAMYGDVMDCAQCLQFAEEENSTFERGKKGKSEILFHWED